MISHGDNCHKCRGKMSIPKPVLDGPKAGQVRVFCTKCGYSVFRPAPSAQQPAQEPQ